MLHTSLIASHATFATLTFVLGAVLMGRLPTSARSRMFAIYYAAAVLTIVLLGSVVILDWGSLPAVKRIAFGILLALGLYMLLRTEQARRALVTRGAGWKKAFIGHVGFVLISLFDGFCIVSAIDLKLPPVVIVVVAVVGVVAGILVIRMLVRRESRIEGSAEQASRGRA